MVSSVNVVGLRTDKTVRIYPNNEAVVFRNKISQSKPFSKTIRTDEGRWRWECWRLFLADPKTFEVSCLFMGLSLVRNFDNLVNPLPEKVLPCAEPKTRYGRKGITRSGARTVRCAAHLMQERYGQGRLTFATVTLPDMPRDMMARVHESWHKVVELYRLGVRRELEKQELPAEILSVSEIQEKRYRKSGVPVLHLHSIWVGRSPYGKWGISTKVHDHLWKKAVMAVVPGLSVSFKSAANLQEVHSSASAYLGKYMTKGASVVRNLIADGFEGWLPRQWWNASRALTDWVKRETVESSDFGDFLLTAADGNDKEVWDFHGHVTIDIGQQQPYWLATYGRLSTKTATELRDFIRLTKRN